MTRRYAEGTTTSVQKSKDELRDVLKRYKATKIIDVSDDEMGDAVQFQMRGRWLRFSAPKPDPEAYRVYTYRGVSGYKHTDQECRDEAEKEYKRRWRVLLLLVKAKMEAILDAESGDDSMDFDREFLGYMLLPDGSTVGDHASAGIEELYLGTGAPTVRGLLGFGEDSKP